MAPETPESPRPRKRRRFGQVIAFTDDPEKRKRYLELHADSCAGVRSMISECHIINFSIYLAELTPGKEYLFAYFEYVGDDYEADMAKMAAYPQMQEWWKVTDACQIRLPGTPEGQQWFPMREVYHND